MHIFWKYLRHNYIYMKRGKTETLGTIACFVWRSSLYFLNYCNNLNYTGFFYIITMVIITFIARLWHWTDILNFIILYYLLIARFLFTELQLQYVYTHTRGQWSQRKQGWTFVYLGSGNHNLFSDVAVNVKLHYSENANEKLVRMVHFH